MRWLTLLLILLVAPSLAEPDSSIWNSSTGSRITISPTQGAVEQVAVQSPGEPRFDYTVVWSQPSGFCYHTPRGVFVARFLGPNEIEVMSPWGDTLYWTRADAKVSTAVPDGRESERSWWRAEDGSQLAILSHPTGLAISRSSAGRTRTTPAKWVSYPDVASYDDGREVVFLNEREIRDGARLYTRQPRPVRYVPEFSRPQPFPPPPTIFSAWDDPDWNPPGY